MAKFLMTVWPLTGHVHPNLALACALRDRGHDVAFYTGESQRRLVESERFRCFPLRHVDERRIEHLVLSSEGILGARGRPMRARALWRAWVLDTIPAQIADLDEVTAEWSPDVIVCDPTMWGPFLIGAERTQIPVAVFSLVPACFLSGPEGPVIGFPRPPARTPSAKVMKALLRAVSHVARADFRRTARQLRRQYGLSDLHGSVTDAAGRAPLYLVPGSPEFDYSRSDLPASVRYVGPCIWEGHGTRSTAGQPSFQRRFPDWPLVFVSEGTVNLEPRVLKAAAQGLAGMRAEVVLATGRHRDPDSLDLGPRPLASNIRVEQWVPYADLLPQLSALVTIGGPSTLLPALQAGIPAVVVPFDWDHPETAWRVHASGAGIRLAPKDCTPNQMREAITRLLTDPSFKASAGRVGAQFRNCGGAPRAAQLLEALAPAAARPRSAAVARASTPTPATRAALAADCNGVH